MNNREAKRMDPVQIEKSEKLHKQDFEYRSSVEKRNKMSISLTDFI